MDDLAIESRPFLGIQATNQTEGRERTVCCASSGINMKYFIIRNY